MTAKAGVVGFAPTVKVGPAINPEREKYRRIWEHAEYRRDSPGEQWAMKFLNQVGNVRDAEVIDFGCGTGRGGLMLALFGAMKVTLFDFAENCLDPEVAQACETQKERIKFVVGDLTVMPTVNAAYAFCCDVMEHIPTGDVPKVLRHILASAHHVFFGISTVQDNLGGLIGEALHLTVQPMSWWLDELRKLGAVVHWTEDWASGFAIYCSAWQDADKVLGDGKVNVDPEVLDAQVIENTRAGWRPVSPHDRQNREVILLAGGPSMPDHLDEIRELRSNGAALVTCNGAYHWAIENDLSISAQIVLDARPFNARFTKPVLDDCRYLIASQAHPATLEGLPRERTYLWHSGISEKAEAVAKECGHFFPIPGGSTIVLRAFALLRMLGYWRFHVFGFDSCVRNGGTHHAYAQPENDHEVMVPLECGGRTFNCSPWMVSQASEFRGLVKFLGDEVEMKVYGDGLIAHMIQTGADLADKEAATA